MLNNVNIDEALTETGKWFQIGLSSFKIAHASNSRCENFLKSFRLGELSEDDIVAILAKYVLIDWKDVKTPAMCEFEYSYANAKLALKSNQGLRDFVISTSQDYSNFATV